MGMFDRKKQGGEGDARSASSVDDALEQVGSAADAPGAADGPSETASPVNPVTLGGKPKGAGKKARASRRKARRAEGSDATDDASSSGDSLLADQLGRRKGLFGRKKEPKRGIVRVKELEEILAEDGMENLDPETIVSMYMPKRRMHRIGAALLRLSTLQKALIVLLLVFAALFSLSFMQENMGNFTINLNRLELFRYGVAIDEDPNFSGATARLSATAVSNGTNIAAEDLPDNLDDVNGSHNGRNYIAYTFYLRNAGKVDLNYNCNVRIVSASKGVEKAARVRIYRNGEQTTYAAAAADGNPEPGCVSFSSDKTVVDIPEENFQVGNVDKYTVVIWLDGDDPECVDDIVGGEVEFAMDFDTLDKDDTNLVVKFVRDIIDTLTGNDPISASGNDAPDYYKEHDVTWDNRRNQENPPAGVD